MSPSPDVPKVNDASTKYRMSYFDEFSRNRKLLLDSLDDDSYFEDDVSNDATGDVEDGVANGVHYDDDEEEMIYNDVDAVLDDTDDNVSDSDVSKTSPTTSKTTLLPSHENVFKFSPVSLGNDFKSGDALTRQDVSYLKRPVQADQDDQLSGPGTATSKSEMTNPDFYCTSCSQQFGNRSV